MWSFPYATLFKHTNSHTVLLLLIYSFLNNSLCLPLLFSSLIIPPSALLSLITVFALPLLCHFSCLPFPLSPRSLPPSSANPIHHLSCRHPCPAHVPALLIPPAPPLPLLLSLSGRCVTLLLLSWCSCGPSPIIDHFDCDSDHFCLFPFLTPSHPKGNQVIMFSSLNKKEEKRKGRK